MKNRTSKLFLAARESEQSSQEIRIPEEGQVQSDTAADQTPAAAQEPVFEEPTPEEQAPGEASEIDEDLAQAEEHDEIEAVAEDAEDSDGLNKASGEIQRLVVTLEALSAQLQEGDVDESSRAVIDSVLQTIETSEIIPVVQATPAAANESLDAWKSRTAISVESILEDLTGSVSVATEGLFERVQAMLGNTQAKIAVMSDNLKKALDAAKSAEDKDIEINPIQYTHLCPLYHTRLKPHEVKNGFLLTAGTSDRLAALISQTAAGKTNFDDWERIIRTHFNTQRHGSHSYFCDFTNGMGPKPVIGTFTHLASVKDKMNFWYYEQSIGTRPPHKAVTPVTLSKQERVELLQTAVNNIDSLKQAHAWLKQAVGTLEAQSAAERVYAVKMARFTLVRLSSTCLAQLIPFELAAYREVLRLAK